MIAPVLQILPDIDEKNVDLVAGPAVNAGEQRHAYGFQGAGEVLVTPKAKFLVSIARYMWCQFEYISRPEECRNMFHPPVGRGIERKMEESIVEMHILLIFEPTIHRPLEYLELDVDKASLNNKTFEGRYVDEHAAHLFGPRTDEIDILVNRRVLRKRAIIGYGVDLILEKLKVSAWCNVAEAGGQRFARLNRLADIVRGILTRSIFWRYSFQFAMLAFIKRLWM